MPLTNTSIYSTCSKHTENYNLHTTMMPTIPSARKHLSNGHGDNNQMQTLWLSRKKFGPRIIPRDLLILPTFWLNSDLHARETWKPDTPVQDGSKLWFQQEDVVE